MYLCLTYITCFLTHAHTDHVLGAVWVVRLVMQLMRQDKYNGVLHIWGHDKVLGVLRWICVHTLPQKLTKLLDDCVLLHEVRDGDTVSIESWQLKCFDIRQRKSNSAFVSICVKARLLLV